LFVGLGVFVWLVCCVWGVMEGVDLFCVGSGRGFFCVRVWGGVGWWWFSSGNRNDRRVVEVVVGIRV
jgi:hypothetical protein